MYGLIAKLTAVPGKRDQMIGMLNDSTAEIPGCLSYVVAKDSAEENGIWVADVWDSIASHDTSLSLPSEQSAIPPAQGVISSLDKIDLTSQVWGAGLPASRAR